MATIQEALATAHRTIDLLSDVLKVYPDAEMDGNHIVAAVRCADSDDMTVDREGGTLRLSRAIGTRGVFSPPVDVEAVLWRLFEQNPAALDKAIDAVSGQVVATVGERK